MPRRHWRTGRRGEPPCSRRRKRFRRCRARANLRNYASSLSGSFPSRPSPNAPRLSRFGPLSLVATGLRFLSLGRPFKLDRRSTSGQHHLPQATRARPEGRIIGRFHHRRFLCADRRQTQTPLALRDADAVVATLLRALCPLSADPPLDRTGDALRV